jgi:hypothetical protein
MKQKNNGEGETALTTITTEQFVALQQEATELQELVEEFFTDGLVENDLELIKIPSGGGRAWDLPKGLSAPTFDGVLLGIQNSRAYWPNTYSGGGTPADCSSRDGITGRGRPGGECKWCELSQWGSGRNGVGTACNPRKTLYILRPVDSLPVRLSLPVTSFTPLRKYQVSLLNQRVRPSAVATRFGLAVAQSKSNIKYSQATFAVAGALDPETALRAKAYAGILASALGGSAKSTAVEEPAPTEIEEDDIPSTWEKNP